MLWAASYQAALFVEAVFAPSSAHEVEWLLDNTVKFVSVLFYIRVVEDLLASRSFEDVTSAYIPFGSGVHLGEVRRFGIQVPAYEVLAVTPSGDVLIEVIESGERLVYARHDFVGDPAAVSVP